MVSSTFMPWFAYSDRSVSRGGLFVQTRAVLRAVLSGVVLAMVAAPAFAQTSTHWQKVMTGERKVGHVEHTRRVQDGRVLASEQLTLELGRAGRRVTYQMRLETETTADGALLRMVRESKTREGHSLLDARVTGDELVVDIGVGTGKHTRRIAGAAQLKGDEFARTWLQSAAAGTVQPPLRYLTFDPAKIAIADVELAAVQVEGTQRIRRSSRAAGTETVTLMSVDRDGNVIDEPLRIAGMPLRLVGSTAQQAMARGEVLDHVVGQLQKSPYRIPGGDMRAKIRYGFEHGGKVPRLPVGAGQRSWSDGQTTWIQVCASCPLDVAELNATERAQALAATPWLNFEDAAITRRAQRLTHGITDDAIKMRRLSAYVREHMTVQQIDMLGNGTALEAFRSRRGDCTEYAVLLAALGRAAGVPTRVVSGLVYARRFEGQRHVFVPHAWVQAWTGTAWQSFDAGIGSFDSTHLAFAMSYDGGPAQLFAGINLAHDLKLRSAARVIPRAD
jgi:hypothetical protein